MLLPWGEFDHHRYHNVYAMDDDGDDDDDYCYCCRYFFVSVVVIVVVNEPAVIEQVEKSRT